VFKTYASHQDATINEYEKEANFLKTRFESARTMAGTHRLHCFIPVSAELIEVRDFSPSPLKRLERVVNSNDPFIVNIAQINGYVTA